MCVRLHHWLALLTRLASAHPAVCCLCPPPPPSLGCAASWDPRREGSLLGWTEFQANVPLLLDRFNKEDK